MKLMRKVVLTTVTKGKKSGGCGGKEKMKKKDKTVISEVKQR